MHNPKATYMMLFGLPSAGAVTGTYQGTCVGGAIAAGVICIISFLT